MSRQIIASFGSRKICSSLIHVLAGNFLAEKKATELLNGNSRRERNKLRSGDAKRNYA